MNDLIGLLFVAGCVVLAVAIRVAIVAAPLVLAGYVILRMMGKL